MALLSPLSAPPGMTPAVPPSPPDVPTLSSIPSNQSGGGDDPGKGKVGALPRLFFNVDKAIDTIAAAVPKFADDLDEVKDTLREILSKALSGGASPDAGPSPDEDGLPLYGK